MLMMKKGQKSSKFQTPTFRLRDVSARQAREILITMRQEEALSARWYYQIWLTDRIMGLGSQGLASGRESPGLFLSQRLDLLGFGWIGLDFPRLGLDFPPPMPGVDEA